MNTAESIRVGCLGSVVWTRIEGAANHENAACIKAFLVDRFDRGWRKFVVDLRDCRGIDSTFIGMLYRLAVKVASSDPLGIVDVINPGERNAKSIQKLGLDDYIHLDLRGERWQSERALVEENLTKASCEKPVNQIEHAEFVLQAHEALIAANEENQNRFCDVVEYLRRELAEAREKNS